MRGERNDVPGGDDARHTLPLAPAAEAERATLPLPGPGAETVPLAEPADPAEGIPLAEPIDPPLPGRVGRFEVRGWLGSGAFGDVYRAHDPQLDREVALKVAKPGSLDTPERLGRFLREAKAAANLRHPNIVPLYETGRDGDRHFIASAFIPGRTLEAVIEDANERKRPLPLDVAARVVRKLADALAYAHSQGVVHRDVKPANVMIDESGEPHLLDFGLAARAEAGDERLTSDGQGMGTPAYMAPEQADGHGIAASDQYSLGCTLYELLTGQTPFAGGPAQQMFLHESEPVPSPRRVRRVLPRDLETVTLKCLEKETGRRYGSCADLAEDLRRFLGGEPVKARRIGPVERFGRWCRRNPAVASSVAFGVLALLIGTVVSLAQADESKRQAKLATDAADDAIVKKKLADAETLRANEAAAGEAAQKKIAVDKADEAVRNKKLADDKADLAVKEAKRANDNAREAKLREDEALFEARKAKDARHGIQIEQGVTAWRRRDYQGTLDALNAMEPEYLNTWETVHMRNLWLRHNSSLRDIVGHTSRVESVCWSPDGKRILSGSWDETVKVWDADTGQEKLTLRGHTSLVTSVCWSPDAKRILSGSSDRTLKVWDADTGQETLTLKGHTNSVSSVCFSPDGKRILSGSKDKTLKVWDADTGQEKLTLKGHTGGVRSVCFSPDGKRILSAGGEDDKPGEVKVWDAETGQEKLTLKGHTGDVNSVCWSPDGKRILTGGRDKTLKVWDADTGQEKLTLKGHTGGVRSVCFSPDGKRILSGSSDDTLKMWDADTGQEKLTLKGHTDGVSSVCLSPDGKRILSGSRDRTATVWDADTGREKLTLRGHTDRVESVCWSPDGKRVLTGSKDKTAKVWDVPPYDLAPPPRPVER